MKKKEWQHSWALSKPYGSERREGRYCIQPITFQLDFCKGARDEVEKFHKFYIIFSGPILIRWCFVRNLPGGGRGPANKRYPGHGASSEVLQSSSEGENFKRIQNITTWFHFSKLSRDFFIANLSFSINALYPFKIFRTISIFRYTADADKIALRSLL